MTTGPLDLGIDPDELVSCVSCGLCLPHCPTWRATGEEDRSPRGRIATMRLVQAGTLLDDAAIESFESCVQCRGCEPACPSGVPFGSMMHQVRAELNASGAHRVPWWQRLGFRVLGHPHLLGLAVAAAAIGGRLRVVPARFGTRHWQVRPLPLRVGARTGAGVECVVVLRGCVMDAIQRSVHQDTIDVLGAAGFDVMVASSSEGCCGALAAHSGLDTLAGEQLAAMTRRVALGHRVVVNSAGCGAHLKEHGGAFADRVVEVSELLAEDPARLAPPGPEWIRPRVAVSDPCHLRHVQQCHAATRVVLDPYAEVVELDDDGVCCGAGGAFSMLRPDEAAAIRSRKLDAIDRSGADVVVSANPGCVMHLRAGGARVSHPIEIMAEAIRQEGGPHGR